MERLRGSGIFLPPVSLSFPLFQSIPFSREQPAGRRTANAPPAAATREGTQKVKASHPALIL